MGSGRDRPASLLDLGPRRGGHGYALDAELAPHVTHAEQLDGAIRSAYESRPEQGVGCHFDALGELVQVPDVHDLRRLLEGVREAALRDAPDERHLPALEPRTGLTAGAGRLTFAAATRRLADPGARAATFADTGAMRAPRRLQCVQRQVRRHHLLGRDHLPALRPSLRLRRHDLRPGLRGRHRDEVTHLIEHTAERRMVPLHDGILMVLEAQRLERAALERRPADARAHLADEQLALAGGRQGAIASHLALAVFPRGWLPSHAPPPGATCRESLRPRSP